MGISIHYSATFGTKHSMKEFVDEVTDIAKTLNWKYQIIDSSEIPEVEGPLEKDCDLFGLLVTPTECESLNLVFHSSRKLINLGCLQLFTKDEWIAHPDWIYTASTKTQFGGAVVHKQIILLFKYLSKKYFKKVKMYDETDYWKKGDDEALTKVFQKMNSLIGMLRGTITDFPIEENEDFEDYFKRILGNSVEIKAIRLDNTDSEKKSDNT